MPRLSLSFLVLLGCGPDAALTDTGPLLDAGPADSPVPDGAIPQDGEVPRDGRVRGDGAVPEDGGPPPIAVGSTHLAFTDLVSGPSTGLGDGEGVGTIITIWGYGLGSEQADSQIEFCDSSDVCRPMAHVYYWKNADGELPGGPANLFESHGMQEVAVSIPESADGLGFIRVSSSGELSTTLPFTVRSGRLLFVRPGGDNTNNCTWDSPCASINGDIRAGAQPNALGNGNLEPGDVVYSGVEEQATGGGGVEAGLFLRELHGTQDSPITIVAYPGSRPTIVSADRGVNPYRTEGIVIAKYRVSVGHVPATDPPNAGASFASDEHIRTTQWGRVVGNHLVQNEGTCFTGWSGAIVGGGVGLSEVRMFGNHIEALGCDNSSRYQHTIYLTVRSEGATAQAWEFGYNYLQDNNVFMGIHYYDEMLSNSGDDCGNVVGTLAIHNNVIINQRGAGINVGTKDRSGTVNVCWEANLEVYNNLLINVGLGVAAEDDVTLPQAIRIGGHLGSEQVVVRNNTVYGYSDGDSRRDQPTAALNLNFELVDPEIIVENNSFYQDCDCDWLDTSESLQANHNAFYGPTTPPTWDNAVLNDPTSRPSPFHWIAVHAHAHDEWRGNHGSQRDHRQWHDHQRDRRPIRHHRGGKPHSHRSGQPTGGRRHGPALTARYLRTCSTERHRSRGGARSLIVRNYVLGEDRRRPRKGETWVQLCVDFLKSARKACLAP